VQSVKHCTYCGDAILLDGVGYHLGAGVSSSGLDEWRCQVCHQTIEQKDWNENFVGNQLTQSTP